MAKGKIVPKNTDKNGKKKQTKQPVSSGAGASHASKKRKAAASTPAEVAAAGSGGKGGAPKPAKKIKKSQQATMEIVEQDPDPYGDGDEVGLDEEDMAFFEENEGANVGFLVDMDTKGIARSKREEQRLHAVEKSQQRLPKASSSKRRARSPSLADTVSTMDSHPSEAPSINLSDDDDDALSSSGSQLLSDDDDDDEEYDSDLMDASDLDLEIPLPHQTSTKKKKRPRDEEEASYEKQSRNYAKRGGGSDSDDDELDPRKGTNVGRLPIKLATGELQKVEGKIHIPSQVKIKRDAQGRPIVEKDSDEESEVNEESADDEPAEGAGLGRRWGRAAVADVVSIKNPAERKRAVKEQIASLGAEIVSGGEIIDNIPLMTRLQSFALPTVPNPNPELKRIPNPISVRAIAIASLLAVYKDLIPGYRIRELTELEQSEKVRDEVKRQRDGEAALVRAYASYLKLLEKEIKDKSPLGSLSLKCMCDLLASVTHFNFRDNIMAVVVGRLSRKSWDMDSDVCLQAITTVFQTDLSSTHALPLVRLLARMIKERHFAVHPNVLSCLWYVKVRADKSKEYIKKPTRKWDKDRDWKKKAERGKGKAKGVEGSEWSQKKKEWRTKKMKKDMREKKEIEREMDEAEAEVDEEEAARNQTETLQHLFVLYFSIIKQTKRTPLLPAALEGLARFAHLVNVDFFRDLLAVLKGIIRGDKLDTWDEADAEDENVDERTTGARTRLRLLGIVTAFELLSGQGEALNIDLNDFIVDLYALIPLLAFDPRLEEAPATSITSTPSLSATNPGARVLHKKSQLAPSVDLFFRALNLVFFSPYASHAISPPWRAAAFAKRLLSASLYFPSTTVLRSIEFVTALIVREPKVEALLATEDRTADGVYRADVDDPQVCNPFATSFFELGVLEATHYDERVRKQAAKLARYNRS